MTIGKEERDSAYEKIKKDLQALASIDATAALAKEMAQKAKAKKEKKKS